MVREEMATLWPVAGGPLAVPPVPRRAARVSPHVDGARAQCRAWAEAMGMVADEPDPDPDPDRLAIWDPATFDAMDFGLFAAATHPDAPAPVLDLLADWYVWLFYVDDVVTIRHASGGMPAVKALLAGTEAHMPRTNEATPTNPPERGAADLHTRTADLAGHDWMARMTGHMRATLDEMRWAAANIDRGRMPDPVEHIAARRAFGGMLWAADMVELGCSIELDPATVGLRPVRVLRESLGDAVGLRNDLVSYRKEIEDGEGPCNAVAVYQRFLGCDVATAARIVHDLFAARLRTFDHAADVDLPEVIADRGIDRATQALLHRTVDGLRDWLAGDEHWILASGRYSRPTAGERALLARGPTGLGTSAARLAACPQPARPAF